ncbi:MAG: hypothetical protein LBP68_08765 [Acidobacteriota bacterium]|jgi:hypothetical protein|nr:hypothetical protein [Acidobacteriota bacterium]
MSEQTVTLSVEAGLRTAFAHVAEKNACDGGDLLRGFMAEYVRQDERNQQYESWFRHKVETGLRELADGNAIPHAMANAQMEAFKAELRRKH